MPHPTTKVELANLAISFLGQEQITDFVEDLPASRAANQWYDICRAHILLVNDWAEAKKEIALAQDPIPPLQRWAYRYALPADYLAMIGFGPWNATVPTPYERKGNYLHTDCSDAYLNYVMNLTDVASMSTLLVEAIASYLAMAIAPELVGEQAAIERAQVWYNETIGLSTFQNKLEQPRPEETASYLVAGRQYDGA